MQEITLSIRGCIWCVYDTHRRGDKLEMINCEGWDIFQWTLHTCTSEIYCDLQLLEVNRSLISTGWVCSTIIRSFCVN